MNSVFHSGSGLTHIHCRQWKLERIISRLFMSLIILVPQSENCNIHVVMQTNGVKLWGKKNDLPKRVL